MTNPFPGRLPPEFEFIRDYKAPEPSSVDSLEGFHAWACDVACQDQDRFGEARSMWAFMDRGHLVGMLWTKFTNEVVKDVSFDLVRAVLRNLPIDQYAFINEMHYVDTTEPGVTWDGTTPPSQHPQRRDGLMIIAQHRDGRVKQKVFRVRYDSKRRPYRTPTTLFDDLDGAGPGWNLFRPALPVSVADFMERAKEKP